LIIISTHGSSGIARWAFGSVADKVVRHAKVPVLISSPAACRID
jgi:nucleotide-binding universal stress UspA family protein